MAADTVNSQITDAVTQTNVKILGESPAQALSVAYQTFAHAVGLAMEGAMQVQGGMQQIATSATTTATTAILKQAK